MIKKTVAHLSMNLLLFTLRSLCDLLTPQQRGQPIVSLQKVSRSSAPLVKKTSHSSEQETQALLVSTERRPHIVVTLATVKAIAPLLAETARSLFLLKDGDVEEDEDVEEDGDVEEDEDGEEDRDVEEDEDGKEDRGPSFDASVLFERADVCLHILEEYVGHVREHLKHCQQEQGIVPLSDEEQIKKVVHDLYEEFSPHVQEFVTETFFL